MGHLCWRKHLPTFEQACESVSERTVSTRENRKRLEVIIMINGKQEFGFSIFLIHSLSKVWGKIPKEVYTIINSCNVIDEYIFPCYDTLHTQGELALIEDITDFVKERGGLS